MTDDTDPKPHSARYFDSSRNFWWNDDFVRLLASRWNLSAVSRVLGVGCGLGHWGRTLSPVLPAAATVVGVDSEQIWIERASERTNHAGLAHRFDYCVADADALPFEDGAFDLVTCQTVLIHVALRYFVAGGGCEADFDALWSLARADVREVVSRLETKQLHAAGGSVMYVIDCRKRQA